MNDKKQRSNPPIGKKLPAPVPAKDQPPAETQNEPIYGDVAIPSEKKRRLQDENEHKLCSKNS